MTHEEILEVLVMSEKPLRPQTYLENEFPYKPSYQKMNLAIMEASKAGKKSINFDFVDNSMEGIEDKTIKEVERNYRRIYPSYASMTTAEYDCFHYPRYLAARGFKVEIQKALKYHQYKAKSYNIEW